MDSFFFSNTNKTVHSHTRSLASVPTLSPTVLYFFFRSQESDFQKTGDSIMSRMRKMGNKMDRLEGSKYGIAIQNACGLGFRCIVSLLPYRIAHISPLSSCDTLHVRHFGSHARCGIGRRGRRLPGRIVRCSSAVAVSTAHQFVALAQVVGKR